VANAWHTNEEAVRTIRFTPVHMCDIWMRIHFYLLDNKSRKVRSVTLGDNNDYLTEDDLVLHSMERI